MEECKKTYVSPSTIVMIIFAFAVGVYLGFKNKTIYTEEQWSLFTVLMISYCITVGLMLVAKVRHNLYLFEPLAFVGILYIAIFVYRPIIDLYNDDMAPRGVNVLPGGVKTTIIFTIGFLSLYIGYYSKKLFAGDNGFKGEKLKESKVLNIDMALLGWIISFTLCIISMISQGLSLRYIFSLASTGEKAFNEDSSPLLFLSNFAITMVSFWMLILVRPGKKITKIIITVLSIIYVIMRNARWLLLIGVLSPITYYYTKQRKSPKLSFLFGIGFITLTIFAWMQVNRSNIIAGRQMIGWGDGGFTIDKLLSPFDSDLTTYKVIYGMVMSYPSKHQYLFGRSFFYIFLMCIPRALWAAKPGNPVNEIVENSLNYESRKAGAIFANIGEFYANFGIIGVILLMFIFGQLIASLKKLYLSDDQEGLIIYSILYPLLFQWVSRGNVTGNIYLTLFALIPFIISRAIVRKKQ